MGAMPRGRVPSLAAVLVGGALLAWAGPAAAAWERPQRASQGPLAAHSPTVAVNARGDGAAAWVRGTGRAAMIVVSLRPAGGAWSEPVGISRRGRPAIDPGVAVDPQGRVTVIWRQVVGSRQVRVRGTLRRRAVYVARVRERLLTDERWSAIVTLSSPRQKVGAPQLGVDDAGRAIAGWHWGTGTTPRDRGFVGEVQITERQADGSWVAPRAVSDSSACVQVRRPRVTVGARGSAVVWWQCDLPRSRSTAVGVSHGPGGAFGPPAELPFRTAGDVFANVSIAGARAVAVSADGDGVLRWWRGDVGTTLVLAQVPALGSPERADTSTGGPRIAVNAAGDALAAWADRFSVPRAAPMSSDLGVGASAALDLPGSPASRMRVSVGGSVRRATVAWIADGRVYAATRAVDGAVERGIPISWVGVTDRDAPVVASDAAGNAVLLWTRVLRGRSVVERAATAAP